MKESLGKYNLGLLYNDSNYSRKNTVIFNNY
jgi:hypothetical protein